MNAVIYSKDGCGFCVAAKNLLDQKGISYVEYNISTQPDKRTELLEAASRENVVPRTVPQIWLNNKYIGGYDKLALFFSEVIDK
jgi:glutaredoxin 3